MKKLIILFSILISASAFGQLPSADPPRTGAISGKVIDDLTKEALPYVNIVVKDNQNKVLTGGITDDQGLFELKKIPEGENTVEIQFIGFKTEVRKITISRAKARHDLGTISLKEDATQLDEVEVIAETSTVVQKVDRKVINVGKDLTSAGATASELLNNVQSVSVDSQSGNISLRGNENVRVLVDGKPSNIDSAQLLKQIPSTSIKSVELITNPSAKYNPEGMSGIINIVLHKNSNQGFNASINNGLTVGLNPRYNGSIDMNYKTGKVNFFANYGYNSGKHENTGYVYRFDNNNNQDFFFKDNRKSHLIKIGADIYLNEKNTVSLYTTQNLSDQRFFGRQEIYFDDIIDKDTEMNVAVDDKDRSYNFNYLLDFEKEGHNIEFEANYSNSESPETGGFEEFINPIDRTLNYDETKGNDRNNTLLNFDYTNPLSENSKLELGVEMRVNETKNSIVTDQHRFLYDENNERIPDGNGWYETEEIDDTSFKYDREIYSAYINFNQKINKLSMQLGARFEQYNVDGSFFDGTDILKYEDEIFSIYPSAFFTYNPSEKNQFQLSYSRRVDRPSIGQVNRIKEWSTPLITSVGNPELKPQFTNSYELNYTRQYEKGSLTFGGFYRRVNDNITRILNSDPDDDNKVILSYANTDSNDRYGFELSSSHKLANWWRTNSSLEFYSQKENGLANGEQIEVTNTSFNARISNSFTATKELRFQLFAMYRGGGESIQFKVDPMWMINAGASLNVLEGKGTFTFRVNDIFQGMKFKFDAENPYPSTGKFNWESRTAYVGFMYRFGAGKNKAKRRKSRDANEAQGGGGFM